MQTTDSPIQCPPIWTDFKDDPPRSDIGHVFVYIDGTRKGRIAQPLAGRLTREDVVTQWPSLLVGSNTVKLDFRPAEGRGTLGIITYDEGPQTEQVYTGDYDVEPADASTEALRTLVGFSTRLMDQNERLNAMVLESGQAAAETQVTSNEKVFSHLILSMERHREQQDAWREREDRRDERELRHKKAAYDTDPTRELITALLPQLLGGGAGGPMSEVQGFIMSKLTEKLMDDVERLSEGGAAPSGMEAVIQQLAPMFTGGSPAPDVPPDTGGG